MKPYYLALFWYFAENVYCVSMNNESKSANWTHIAVRKPLNTSIIVATFDTVSLTGCASACTWSGREIMAPSFNFEQDLGKCHCNNALDDTEDDQGQPEVTYGILQPEFQDKICHANDTKQDCDAHFKEGCVDNGFCKIRPSRNGPIKDVFCYFWAGGGWTWTQSRDRDLFTKTYGKTFNQGWKDYVNGFGEKDGERWIGLESLHHLTKRGGKLLIIIGLQAGTKVYLINSTYSNFTVGDAASNYTLHVSGYHGNFGDSLSSHNGMPFSVPNGDNQCADTCAGGWWYRGDGHCGQAIVNLMAHGNPQCPIWATSNIPYDRLVGTYMFVEPLGTF